jgi:hypothetical protein
MIVLSHLMMGRFSLRRFSLRVSYAEVQIKG